MRYFEIKNKEFISNPEDSGPFDLLKTIVGYELHMAGVAVDKLGDEFPNAAKLGNNILELINMPFNWAGEKAAEGYKFTKKELIENIKNKYGEDAGYKTEYYINQAENKIAEKLAKFAPTDMQQKTLKFFEGLGVAKLATKPLIGAKKIFTKGDDLPSKKLKDFDPDAKKVNTDTKLDSVNTYETKKTSINENPILDKTRVGSAKKSDLHHSFNDIIDNYAGDASKFQIPSKSPGGKISRMSELRQLEGSYNGKNGIFEWIIDNNQVTHRRFIPNGKITGYPNQLVKKGE